MMRYEALSGVLPFEGTTPLEVFQRKLTLDAPQLYLSALRELGILEPARGLRGYCPELFHDTPRRGAV